MMWGRLCGSRQVAVPNPSVHHPAVPPEEDLLEIVPVTVRPPTPPHEIDLCGVQHYESHLRRGEVLRLTQLQVYEVVTDEKREFVIGILEENKKILCPLLYPRNRIPYLQRGNPARYYRVKLQIEGKTAYHYEQVPKQDTSIPYWEPVNESHIVRAKNYETYYG